MKLVLIKTLNNTFKLAHNTDFEAAKKIPVGEPIEYEYRKPRNYQFHKKFFALMELVFQNQERYINKDHLRRDLTVAAGYYDERVNLEGEAVLEPKSISFASMDEEEFSRFYEAMLDVVVQYFGHAREELVSEIENFY